MRPRTKKEKRYYIPAAELGSGRLRLTMRFAPTANNQVRKVRFADRYLDLQDPDPNLVGRADGASGTRTRGLRLAKPALSQLSYGPFRAIVGVVRRTEALTGDSLRNLTMDPAPVGIVGAGPAGLAAADALQNAGIEYEVLERHDAVGGIWDIENPGSPMYESAHFISSKTLSGFDGHPFPDEYPDYPNRVQALDYIRSFARDRGLSDHITLGIGAESAEANPAGGWDVELSDGDTRHYSHLVAANGPNGPRASPTTPASSPARRSTRATTAPPTSSATGAS